MPLYEGRHNVENRIKISEDAKKTVICGTDAVIADIAAAIKAADGAVALDGWYGVDFADVVCRLKAAGVEVDRRMLAELAVHDEAAFTALVEVARANVPAQGEKAESAA